MNTIIYLEPDDEITAVIDKIRKSDQNGVVLVIPRGGTIAQSIVNLKLLKRSSEDLSKSIAFVTTDKISKNLITQIDIPTFNTVKEAEGAKLEPLKAKSTAQEDEEFEAKTYRKYDLSQLNKNGEKAEVEDLPSEEDQDLEDQEEEKSSEKSGKVSGAEIESEDEDDGSAVYDDERESYEEGKEDTDEYDQEQDNDSGRIDEDQVSEKKVDNSSDHKGEQEMDKKDNAIKQHKNQKSEGSRRVLAVFSTVLAVCLLLILVSMYVILPTADVSVVLKTQSKDEELNVTVDKNASAADVANLVLPGRPVESQKEVSKGYPATGQKDLGEKATGKITISNSLSQKTQVLGKGTKATTDDGKVFLLSDGVMVPGATPSLNNCKIVSGVFQCDMLPGTAEVSVVASETGEQYNIAPGKFKVGNLTAESKTAFSGGVTKIMKYVTDEDLQKAETDLRQSTFDQTKQSLLDGAKNESIVVSADSITDTIISSSSDKKANEEADNFTYSLKIKYFVLGYSDDDLRALVIEKAKASLDSGQMILNSEDSEVASAIADNDKSNGIIKLSAKLTIKIGKNMSAQSLSQEIKNKSVTAATSYLGNIHGVERANISVWPKFLNRLPLMAEKIKVAFDYTD